MWRRIATTILRTIAGMKSVRLRLLLRYLGTFSKPLTNRRGHDVSRVPLQERDRSLVEGRQGCNVEFEGLVVLALDLEFGLQFLDQQFQARDFSFQFLDVGGAGLRAVRSSHIEIMRRRMRILRRVLLIL